MADSIITGILAWFHIISVIGWSGAALTFLVAVGPSLKRLSPQANSEIALKMFPGYVRTIQVFAVLTLIFGPLLAFTMNALNDLGGPNAFDLISPWSRLITAGASVGIFTFFLVSFFYSNSERAGSFGSEDATKPSAASSRKVWRVTETHCNSWAFSCSAFAFGRDIHGSGSTIIDC